MTVQVQVPAEDESEKRKENSPQEGQSHQNSSTDEAIRTVPQVSEIRTVPQVSEMSSSSFPPQPSNVRQHLDRELKLAETHAKECQSQWRQILSKEKFEELNKDMPTLEQYHNKSAQRKQDVLANFLSEIKYLQDLYQEAMVANMCRTEELISIHDNQVVSLDEQFRGKLRKAQDQSDRAMKNLTAQYDGQIIQVKESIAHNEREVKARDRKARQKHTLALHTIREEHIENMNNVRFVLETKMEGLTQELEQAKNAFACQTEATKGSYHKLKARDDAIRQDIESKTRQANQCQREIHRLQLITRQEEAQLETEHEELLERKTRAISRWNMTQGQINKYRQDQQQKLVNLIKRANRYKDELQKQCEIAHRAKQIALDCCQLNEARSLERSATQSTHDDGYTDNTDVNQSPDNKQAFVMKCLGRLGNESQGFWKRYNAAKIDVLKLEKHVRHLSGRGESLESKLKQYQDGITVNNNALRGHNPLFVVNGKMNAPVAAANKKIRRRLTVVEGNHFIATNKYAITQAVA